MRAPLELVGRLKSPLQRQIDVKILIGAAANSGDGFDFSGPALANILEKRVRELGNQEEAPLRATQVFDWQDSQAKSSRIAGTTEGYWMHPEAPVVTIIRTGGPRYVR